MTVEPTATAGREQGLRVLIVEDESLVSLFLQGVLQDLGHRVSGVAPSLRTALAIAAGTPSDLAIVDIGLAGDGGDGIDAAIALRSRYGIPALLMSGFPSTTSASPVRRAARRLPEQTLYGERRRDGAAERARADDGGVSEELRDFQGMESMASAAIETAVVDDSPGTLRPAAALERREILRALRLLRRGDFSVRLPRTSPASTARSPAPSTKWSSSTTP